MWLQQPSFLQNVGLPDLLFAFNCFDKTVALNWLLIGYLEITLPSGIVYDNRLTE